MAASRVGRGRAGPATRVLVAATGAVLLLVAGCSSGGHAVSSAPPVSNAFDDLSPEIQAEMRLVPGIASGLWGQPDELGSLWTEPTIVYYRNGEVPDDPCGRAHPDPEEWLDNSFFCPDDGHVLLDVNLLATQAAANGKDAAAVIAMHELGHRADHLQKHDGTFAINEENQADCDAGAQMAYAVHTQKISVVDAIIDGALGLFGGGQSSTPTWWDSDAHGLSGQRFDAFFVGYDAVRDGHSGRDACWDQVGQATPGPSVQVGPFPVGLETGAVVGTPSGDVTSVSLPEARGLTAQLYATADKTIVPADVFESWAARWFGSDAYILRNGSLDPLTFTFAKYPWSVPLDRAVGAGASAHMSYYYDATAGRSGIFAVITYPHTGAVELALSLPAAGQSSADASEALQEGLYFLLDGIQAGLPAT